MNERTLDITWMSIVKILIAGFVLYVLFLARDIVIWFFFALIVSLLLEPVISFLRKFRIPKVIAVLAVYMFIFFVIGFLVYLSAPILINETKQLSANIPDYFEQLNPVLKNLGFEVSKNFDEFTGSLIGALSAGSDNIFKAVSVFFGGVASAILIFTFAFYISLEDKGVENVLVLLAPKKYEEYILSIFHRAQFKVAGWFGARILACIFVAVASFVVFFLFGVKYAFILSLISGILTFIPFIGPLITAIIVLLFIGASNSWFVALYIVVALAIIQQIENSIITPLLMKRIINLPPVLVLVSLLIGSILFGILGMIFLVPVFGIIYEFLGEFLMRKKLENGL